MPDCVKVSKEPKSGGIDLELENGYVYECGGNWFKTQESTDYYLRHLRDKNWFTADIEDRVIGLVGFRPTEQRRD